MRMCNHPSFRTGSIEFILSLARLKGAFLRTRMSLSGSFASDIRPTVRLCTSEMLQNRTSTTHQDATFCHFCGCGLKSGRRTCPDNHLTTAQS
jgi:hypothetical protein